MKQLVAAGLVLASLALNSAANAASWPDKPLGVPVSLTKA